MKKIIAMAVAAVCLVSATFALNFEVGGRAILGRNLADGSWNENYQAAKQDKTFDFGGGLYTNFALFGGLGIQAEANYVKSSIKFQATDDGKTENVDYELHTLDLAPMAWLNLDLWKFTLGFGAGPNFSIPLASLGDITNATKADFTVGLITGADFKFYVTDHLGLVLSGRYIMNWNKEDVELKVGELETGKSYPKYSYSRRTLYGGLGVEWKFF